MARKQAGKRYRSDAEKIPVESVPLTEAVNRVKAFKKVKFDQSVDVVMYLGIDPKQSDQNIRGAVSLPHGIGQTKRVIAFCGDDKVQDALDAGAVKAGGEELVGEVEGGFLDFDVAVASPDMMRVVSRLGRVLGPKGLMPSPKAGTVTPNVAQAVTEYAAGKVEYRSDKFGNVAASVGKHSFDPQQLEDNAKAFIDHIHAQRPTSTKGTYVKKISISGTMTPSILVTE